MQLSNAHIFRIRSAHFLQNAMLVREFPKDREAANKEKALQLGSMHPEVANATGRGYTPQLVVRILGAAGSSLPTDGEWTRPKWKLKLAFPMQSSGSSSAGVGEHHKHATEDGLSRADPEGCRFDHWQGGMQIHNILEQSGANVQILQVANANNPAG